MSKLGFLVAVSVVSLGAAVGAWYYKYQLYGWLPSTASSELKNVDGLLMDKEGKPFTGRVKDISDSGYSLDAYKDGKLDGLGVSGFLCLGRLFQGQPNEAALCI